MGRNVVYFNFLIVPRCVFFHVASLQAGNIDSILCSDENGFTAYVLLKFDFIHSIFNNTTLNLLKLSLKFQAGKDKTHGLRP